MIKILKLLILLIVLSVFCFSENQTISSVRNFVADNGKALYQKGTIVMSQSTVKPIAYTGNLIK